MMASSADPIAGVAQVLSVFIGAATAAVVAPHLVVFIAGAAGGVFGLMSWRQCTVFEGLGYVAGMGLLAWLLAGSLAEAAGALWPFIGDRRGLAPVALAVGWVGHRWPDVGRWLGRLFKRWAEAAISNSGKTK
jgi:hypothetical protein